jgi:hypothetical protein
VQDEAFHLEHKLIHEGKPLKKISPLFRLNVFTDNEGLIRVGGRIKKSDQPYDDTKHQIVLPKHCHVTNILVRAFHEEHGHVGLQALLSIVRQTYWPIGASDVMKSSTRKCVRCFRYKPKTADKFMGDPFVNTGIDYALLENNYNIMN